MEYGFEAVMRSASKDTLQRSYPVIVLCNYWMQEILEGRFNITGDCVAKAVSFVRGYRQISPQEVIRGTETDKYNYLTDRQLFLVCKVLLEVYKKNTKERLLCTR